MKDIRVDGIFQRVFVLKESAERLVYIPIKTLHRTDYDRLIAIEKSSGNSDMLDSMRKVKLDNGKNALVLYDSLIQVIEVKEVVNNITIGTRLRKPTEPEPRTSDIRIVGNKEEKSQVDDITKAFTEALEGLANKPKGKGGRPPGAKNKPKTPEVGDSVSVGDGVSIGDIS